MSRVSSFEKMVADVRCKRFVHERDRYQCLRCGQRKPLECAHVISRANLCVRWYPDNLGSLCRPCHEAFDAKRKASRRWWEERIGPERWNKLVERSRMRFDRERMLAPWLP